MINAKIEIAKPIALNTINNARITASNIAKRIPKLVLTFINHSTGHIVRCWSTLARNATRALRIQKKRKSFSEFII